MVVPAVLLAWIDEDVAKSLSKSGRSTYLLNKSGLFLVEKEHLAAVADSVISQNFSEALSPETSLEIFESTRKFEPIFRRWAQAEKTYGEEAVGFGMEVLRRAQILKWLGISRVVFGTGIPHHIDSLSLSIACEVGKISQIHLYPTVFDRVLLAISHSSFENRKPLQIESWDTNPAEEIELFLEKRRHSSQPVLFGRETPAMKSPWLAALRAVSIYLVSWARRNLCSPQTFGEKQIHSPFVRVVTIVRQQRYLRKVRARGDLKISQLECGTIVIMAHVEPESTSFPEGLPWRTQLEFVAAVRQAFPTSRIIFKEHPATKYFSGTTHGFSDVGRYRSPSFIHVLNDLRIDIVWDLPKLEKGCFLPLTLTGTIAIENSLNGLTTLIAGKPWYSGLPGTIMWETFTLGDKHCNCSPSMRIAAEARVFLESRIRSSGIPNYQGIGTGREMRAEKNQFIKGIEKIMGAENG